MARHVEQKTALATTKIHFAGFAFAKNFGKRVIAKIVFRDECGVHCRTILENMRGKVKNYPRLYGERSRDKPRKRELFRRVPLNAGVVIYLVAGDSAEEKEHFRSDCLDGAFLIATLR